VNYDADNWKKIFQQLVNDPKSIHRRNRAQLIDDSMTLAKAGQLSYPIALAISSYISQEIDYIPWTSMLNNFEYIERLLRRTAFYGEYKTFMIGQLLLLYSSIGFNKKGTDKSMDALLRVRMSDGLCKLGYPDCEERSIQQFKTWRNSKCKTNPNQTELFK
jgi:hypothetical protein